MRSNLVRTVVKTLGATLFSALMSGVCLADVAADSALIQAVEQRQSTQIIGELIAKGADVNAMSESGTPLMLAANKGDVETVRLLVEKGANIDTVVKGQGVELTALMAATMPGRLEVMRFLVERGAQLNTVGTLGSALYVSLIVRQPEATQFLLESGADVNVGLKNGMSPLMGAARFRDIETARQLIKHGANVNARTVEGQTALLTAVQFDSFSWHEGLEFAKWLIEKGADVNAAMDDGLSPLMLGVHEKNTDMVSFLLEKGANVNAMTTEGMTPLMFAVRDRISPWERQQMQSGSVITNELDGEVMKIIELLVEHGADVNAMTKDGRTALSIVRDANNRQIAQYLIENGAKEVVAKPH